MPDRGSEPPTVCVVKLACGQGGGCRSKTPKRQGERGPCYGRAGRFWKTDIFLPDQRIRGLLFAGPRRSECATAHFTTGAINLLGTPRLPTRTRTSPNLTAGRGDGQELLIRARLRNQKTGTEKDACVPAPERGPVRKVVSSPWPGLWESGRIALKRFNREVGKNRLNISRFMKENWISSLGFKKTPPCGLACRPLPAVLLAPPAAGSRGIHASHPRSAFHSQLWRVGRSRCKPLKSLKTAMEIARVGRACRVSRKWRLTH